MDYEKLMNAAMEFICLTMKSCDDLAKEAIESNDKEKATRYMNQYIAARGIKLGIDKLALEMKNGK